MEIAGVLVSSRMGRVKIYTSGLCYNELPSSWKIGSRQRGSNYVVRIDLDVAYSCEGYFDSSLLYTYDVNAAVDNFGHAVIVDRKSSRTESMQYGEGFRFAFVPILAVKLRPV